MVHQGCPVISPVLVSSGASLPGAFDVTAIGHCFVDVPLFPYRFRRDIDAKAISIRKVADQRVGRQSFSTLNHIFPKTSYTSAINRSI
jgi:hypothetical protein